MPANTLPIFPNVPISTMVAVSASATPSRTTASGTPSNSVLISPATNTNGIKVDKIQVQGTGTTLAGIINIWLYDGTTSAVIDEIAVTVVTPSTTVAAFQKYLTYSDLVLAPNCRLYATSQVNSQLVTVGMTGGAY